MPLTDYIAPPWLRSGHLQTLYPSLLRRVEPVAYRRERIATADDDFLDLDWATVGSESLAVISHGLEGHSRRAYVQGMVRAFNQAGVDALAWNFRGCSGEPNRRLRLYHNGAFDDLDTVIRHAAPAYRSLYLVGFSLGGNMTLLYLGKEAATLPEAVKGGVVFSAPCDLTDAAVALARRENTVYMRYFLRSLEEKIRAKQERFPGAVDLHSFEQIRTFRDFDERYTAPLHGFAGAADYWTRCSSRPWLQAIEVPTLIVNAADDPFLAGGCYPEAECAANDQVTLQVTRHGGHVGFVRHGHGGRYWSEERAVGFVRAVDGREGR